MKWRVWQEHGMWYAQRGCLRLWCVDQRTAYSVIAGLGRAR